VVSSAEVTVIVPTHNRRDLLRRTLDSILRQRGVSLEVVVVDDGGYDGTSDAIRDLGMPEVRVVRHPQSRGVSAARNTGLADARTSWVAFVDDDDLWAPDKLSEQLASIKAVEGARWACVGAVHVNESLDVIAQSPTPESGFVDTVMPYRNVIPGGGSGVLVETDLARAVGGFDEDISILADWDFYLRLSLQSAVAAVNRPLMAYFVHADSMFHDPENIMVELKYLDRKYRHLTDGTSFHHNPFYVVGSVLMAYRLDKKAVARRIVMEGLRRGDGWLMTRDILQRVQRKVRQTEPPYQFEESVESWLSRYRAWEFPVLG
jgi:glycosyltransferase involved in cell wall biosynthesis